MYSARAECMAYEKFYIGKVMCPYTPRERSVCVRRFKRHNSGINIIFGERHLNFSMKRILLPITGLLFTFSLWAQETEKRVVSEDDSLHILSPVMSGQEFFYPGSGAQMPVSLFTLPELPAFNFQQYLQPDWSKYNSSWIVNSERSSSFISSVFFPSAYGTSGVIFNQASYRLTPRLSVGGNSFGINAILHAPVQRSFADQWQWRGASMFLEYKFSKNFRIETRVSVTGNQWQP
jgi:hypothetical protein